MFCSAFQRYSYELLHHLCASTVQQLRDRQCKDITFVLVPQCEYHWILKSRLKAIKFLNILMSSTRVLKTEPS